MLAEWVSVSLSGEATRNGRRLKSSLRGNEEMLEFTEGDERESVSLIYLYCVFIGRLVRRCCGWQLESSLRRNELFLLFTYGDGRESVMCIYLSSLYLIEYMVRRCNDDGLNRVYLGINIC